MIELLRTRRSIRKYKDKIIDDATVTQLKEALLRSPSSRGFNPWEFIFIDDKKIIKQLSIAKKYGSEFLKDAALSIVVLGNEKKSDVWIEDCSIASIILQLTAHSLGLGSCWIQIRNRDHNNELTSEKYVQRLLGIPEHQRVLSLISLGYPDEQATPVSIDKLQFDKIHKNVFSQ